MQNEKLKIKRAIAAFFILNFALLISACEMPNLESAECSQARDAARKFYSFHFDNDMRPSVENLKMRERFLSPNFRFKLGADVSGQPPTVIDTFTQSEVPPRTFKIGECKPKTPTEVDLQIQLYWRDDQQTVQKEVVASMLKQGDSWVLDGVGLKY